MPGVIRLKVAASEESVTLRSASGSLAVEAVSPHVAFERVTGGTKMTVTDVDGEQSVVIPDGEAGDDGFSPTVTITEIEGGHRITITDKNGAHTADVMDGEGGGSAVSPTATVVKSGNTATITITDKNGTTTASISDGADGQDGTDGQDGNDGYSPTVTITKSGNTATISITDKNGTTTATVTDGADGVTFTPSVSNEGVISWSNDGGKTNPQSVSIKGPKGDTGDDYVLTAQDKADIAAEVGAVMVVAVSGTTPSITAQAGYRYKCGTVSTLTFTPCADGVCDVIFTSGSTPTVLTVPSTLRWMSGFDPASIASNATYELNVMDGTLGVAAKWT